MHRELGFLSQHKSQVHEAGMIVRGKQFFMIPLLFQNCSAGQRHQQLLSSEHDAMEI
jgi:hypothetical protein